MGKLTKRVRKYRNSTRQKKRMGGCGCGSIGGKRKNKSKKVSGGSQHLTTLPLRYYYPLNDHSSSLSKSYGTESSSAIFSGGKKIKSKKKRMKGGGIIDAIFNGPQLNVSTGFGTTVGAKMLYDVQMLNNNNNNDNVLNQPAGNLNNSHSPLLV